MIYIVPAVNFNTATSEISQVQIWAEENNLTLNCQKSKDIIFTGRGTPRALSGHQPGTQSHSTWCCIVLNDKLTAADHVSSLLASCSSSLYAMRVLRNHGIPATSLTDIFHKSIAKLTYCSPAWSGLTSAQDRARIDAFLRRSKCYGYCADSVPLITDIFAEADQSMFRRILNNESHVLHQLLPETRSQAVAKIADRTAKNSMGHVT